MRVNTVLKVALPRHISRIGSLLLSGLLVSCAASHKEFEWTQEVRLEDLSTITVERYVAFDATNAMGGGAFNAVEKRATLKFTGELASLPAWDVPRLALVLYRNKQSGNWVVVSTTTSCEVWRANGKPRPPYWQHELIAGEWRLVPLSEESIGKDTNLFYRYWRGDFPKHMTVSEAMRRQSAPTIAAKYRRIAKDPETNCY